MDEFCFNFIFPKNEELPKGDDFWMIAEGLSMFPGYKGMLTVWETNTPGKYLLAMKPHVLGKEIPLRRIASADSTWCGGFDPVDLDSKGLLRFAICPGASSFGQPTLPRVNLVVSKTIMDASGPNYFNLFLGKLLELIGRSKAAWGFVDLFPEQMSRGGSAFGTVGYSDLASLMLSREAVWHARSRKGICLSGIHWGNFLGNTLLDKIGGRIPFLEMLKHELTLPNGKLYGVIRELDSGLFFSLCPSPEEFTSDSTVGQHLKWFAELLVDHGLI